ncbi:MAG TPA: ATP synthase F0 subunit C [Bryobacteraceae bacterium]|jgi:F-type H+-transporting ATPase subunit c|nr:ATP synthase F0 subunit C [Bryobacteraceae bacterium]
MRTKLLILMALFLVVAAVPAFAQGTTGGSGVSAGEIKAGMLVIGMAVASGLCGLGQGKAVASAAEAVARNPGAKEGIQTLLVLGLAFIESLAIFTLLIVFTNKSLI